jgi:tetratricopeptide (TPR) repeat protein
MKFIPAVCPNCSGKLQLPDDKVKVKCMYCEADIVVQKVIKPTLQANTDNLMRLGENALKSNNNEEAYKYYSRVLEVEADNSLAWFGKGEAAAWMSTLANFKIPEMVVCFDNAIEGSENPESIKRKAVRSVNKVCVAYYELAGNHLLEYMNLDGSWDDYLQHCNKIMQALEHAHKLQPNDYTTIDNIIHICTENIEIIKRINSNHYEFDAVPPTANFENQMRRKLNRYVGIMKTIKPSYQAPVIQKQQSVGLLAVFATFLLISLLVVLTVIYNI